MAHRWLDGASAWVAVLLLSSAGTFLYVATVDTLPGVHDEQGGRATALNVLFGAVVFAVVFADSTPLV